MKYYSTIKRRKIVSFVETWMKLESVIESEVGQKEENEYHILMHICGIQKNGIQLILFAKQKQRHRHREQMDTKGEGRVGRAGGLRLTYTLLILCIKQIINENILYSTRNICTVLNRMGRKPKRERIYVYVWLIHFVVQQKLKQHCKATILQ